MEKLPKIALPFIVLGIFLLLLITKSAVTIGPGEAGVLFQRFGDGVKQQSISDQMNVLSVNGLEVRVNGTVWYEPEYKNLGLLIKTKGEDYERELLDPAINAAARSVVGRYTPEQLYSSKRDVIEKEILEEATKLLSGQYLTVKRILVEDVQLPPTIKQAIERKLKQEQESLEYEFRLVTAQKEAEKQIIEAEGKAKSNKILSASLTDKILQDKGIEATIKLSESDNSKVIVIGSGDSGMPIILGNQ